MSRSAPLSFSEGIDGIKRRRRAQMRLKGRAVDHINWPSEETGDILFEADVFVDRPFGGGLKLHQYVEVTVRPVVAARNRAEHGGVRHATRAQGALVATESGKGFLNVHIYKYSTKDSQREPWRTAGFLRASKCACAHKRALPIDAGSAQLAADQRLRCKPRNHRDNRNHKRHGR